MEVASSSVTLSSTYKSTQCCNSQNQNLNSSPSWSPQIFCLTYYSTEIGKVYVSLNYLNTETWNELLCAELMFYMKPYRVLWTCIPLVTLLIKWVGKKHWQCLIVWNYPQVTSMGCGAGCSVACHAKMELYFCSFICLHGIVLDKRDNSVFKQHNHVSWWNKA
jgi:hypothetical protein